MEPNAITDAKTASIVDDMQNIIEAARTHAYQAIKVGCSICLRIIKHANKDRLLAICLHRVGKFSKPSMSS